MGLRLFGVFHCKGIGKTLSAIRVTGSARGGRFQVRAGVNTDAVRNIRQTNQLTRFSGVNHVPVRSVSLLLPFRYEAHNAFFKARGVFVPIPIFNGLREGFGVQGRSTRCRFMLNCDRAFNQLAIRTNIKLLNNSGGIPLERPFASFSSVFQNAL